MTSFAFRQPIWLAFLALLPLLVWYRRWLLARAARALPYPQARLLEALGRRNGYFPWIAAALLLLSFAGMALALARPSLRSTRAPVTTEGVAIMLVLDASGSMMAEDFKPNNRIDVARTVLSDFIKKRKDDRMGLITFAAMPFLRCPLTSDHKTLLSLVREVKSVSRSELDGTAIGDALVAAGKRLLSAPEKSRVVILLTDGENNRGQFEPLQAAQLLAAQKMRVDVVGIGSSGVVPYPIIGQGGRKSYQFVHIGFNEPSLKAIAESTSGVYYNATDSRGLERIFDTIDRLERTRVTATGYVRYRELFPYPLGLAVLALVLHTLWRIGPGRTLP